MAHMAPELMNCIKKHRLRIQFHIFALYCPLKAPDAYYKVEYIVAYGAIMIYYGYV